ncbi:MAG: T9SS type A sorting domain-containing protein [Flavobacteriales bacterium]|nr:T9SS type A sorting domain-containing protein [Flavobacteriales bacterium]
MLLSVPSISQATRHRCRSVSNTTGCSGQTYVLKLKDSYGNSYYLNGNSSSYQWIEEEDGTARLVATGFTHSYLSGDNITIDLLFSSPTTSTPSGSPQYNSCGSTGSCNDWTYYETVSGTITSKIHGVFSISRRGPACQKGTNANTTQQGYGASGWGNCSGGDGFFDECDVNMMLSSSCEEKEIECERNVLNTVGCANEPYVLWFTNKYNTSFHLDGDTASYKWYQYTNGDVRLVGSGLTHPSLTNDTYDIDITFSGATTTVPSGSPKASNCGSVSSYNGWIYFTSTLGVVRSSKHGSFIVSRQGPAFQQGMDANITQTGYGASGWLYVSGGDGYISNGDINVMLSQSCDEPSDDCQGSNSYDPCIVTYAKGSAGNTTTSISINEPVSEIQEIVLEAIYKGGQPTYGSFQSGGNYYSWSTGNAQSLDNVSGTTDKGYYKATMPPSSTVKLHVNNNTSKMHGFTAYVRLKDEYCSNNYTDLTDEHYYVYHNTKTTNFSLPTTTLPKTITATLPIVEMNNDSRIATFTLTAGGISESVTINTYDLGQSMTVQTLVLNDVPGNVTSGTLTFASPSSNGDSYVTGNAVVNWYNPCEGSDPNVNTISGYTYYDLNRDTTLNEGEEGVAGTTVFLYEDSNHNGILESGESTPLNTATTDENGYYEFAVDYECTSSYAGSVEYSSGIPDPNDALGDPGSSYAEFTMNSYNLILDLDGEIAQGEEYTIYLKAIGSNPYAIISESTDGVNFYHNTNILITSYSKEAYTITAGRNVNYIKFDKGSINSISGYNQHGSTSTNSSDYGIYGVEFCDGRNSYIIATNPSTLPTNSELTTDNIETASFTSGGNHDSLNNFGITGNVLIDGYVFHDQNSNGSRESNEPGQSGITVYLYNDLDLDGLLDGNESTPIDSVQTNNSGYYSFEREYGCVEYFVSEVIESSGIVNPSNLLGAVNGDFAAYDTDSDNLIVELDGVIAQGETYTIHLGAIEAGAFAIISESTDGVNFYHNVNIEILSSGSDGYTITADRDVRYIKFDKHEINSILGLNIIGSAFTNVNDYAIYGIEYCNSLINGYYINTRQTDYPSGTSLTTDNKETAQFTSYGQEDLNNDFGFNTEGGTGEFCGSLKVTINHTKVEGNETLYDFPVYFEITNDALKSASNGGKVASEDGYDIQLTNATGGRLDIELIDYDPVTGHIIFWGNVDMVKHDENTVLYLRHGNEDSALVNPSSPSTWESSFRAVYHFDDLRDATSNDNDPTNYSTSSTDGVLGNGRYFDGNDYMKVPSSSSLNVGGKHITMSAWVRIHGTPVDDAPFAVKGPSVNQEAYMFGVNSGTNPVEINSRVTTNTGHYRHDNGSVATYEWALVHFVYDGTQGSNQKKVYVNGDLEYTATATGDIIQGNDDLFIGKRVYSDNRYFKGKIDELRISSSSRTAGWIGTEYNNQFNPNQFITVEEGTECTEPVPVTWMDFVAVNETQHVNRLTWSTASEINNDRFEIQRRWEGETTFTTVGTVNGNGNSSTIQNYQYLDVFGEAKADVVYYRLKQVDYDGTTDFSEIEIVRLNANGVQLSNNMFPVPANKEVYVEVKETTLRNADDAAIRIIDVQGRDVTTNADQSIDGNLIRINVENLPTGVYVLELSVGYNTEILRLLVDHNSRN